MEFMELQSWTETITFVMEKTEKYVRKFKNWSYNNYDEEAYSRTPNLYITRKVFEEIKMDVKKT
uniref:Uncharacterized protein n=1 Tax=Cucumis melo TaxID=3656 RepID=A0A9I9EB98_CUCME